MPSVPDYLLGVQAMSRSLILFNALFALQSGLDLVYLWGGATLPDGMSHAEYAHRGAYPLIVTALLAAGFVLIAMRPGGPAEQSRLIRPLVLAWIGQNVLLVISSIFRLDLYVAAFSLTYLRLAAFIWMGLVAAGLLLILIQIMLRKPDFLAGHRQCRDAGAGAVRLLFHQCPADHRRLQCGALPGSRRHRTFARYELSALAGTAGPARARTATAADSRRSSQRLRTCDPVETFVRTSSGVWKTGAPGVFGHGACNDIWLTIPPHRPFPSKAAKASATMAHSILVVDDDPHIRDVVRFAFEKTGMTISIAPGRQGGAAPVRPQRP